LNFYVNINRLAALSRLAIKLFADLIYIRGKMNIRITQNRIVKHYTDVLKYDYLGN